jgi:Glycosyltransferases involved in cell wall biogenesis
MAPATWRERLQIRMREREVIDNAALPEGWFGKQWACQNGARAARGEIICFADADTTQSPDLITRSVNAIERRHADLFSVAGRQELGGFWEKLVQPQMFGLLIIRYGGTDSVTNSKRVTTRLQTASVSLSGRPRTPRLAATSW